MATSRLRPVAAVRWMTIEAPRGGVAATTVVLRARQHWQALDLGLALVREHAAMLYGPWLVLTLPVAIVLSVILQRWPLIALVVFWWLKPLYERLPLLYLSKVVFGERLTAVELARSFLRTARVQLLMTLTWRRLSMTRSMDQPIALLEGASGARRRARLQVLHRQTGFYATVLLALLQTLEMASALSNRLLLLLLVPGQAEQLTLTKITQSQLGLWPYFIAVWMVGPLYAACGFSLYINRRCDLEGWDIEVGFRRLAARLRGGAVLMSCLCCALLLVGSPRAPAAASAAAPLVTAAQASQQQHAVAPSPPNAAAVESQRIVERVLADAEFHSVDSRRWPAMLEGWSIESDQRDNLRLPHWLRSMVANLVDIVWWLAWAIVISVVVWLAYRYRYWLAELVGRRRTPRENSFAPSAVVAGVQLGAAATANDSAANVVTLWARAEQRAAVAMLLRLTLVDLVRRHGCEFAHGDTEFDCTRRVMATQPPERAGYFQRLIDVWQNAAYAHRLPTAHTFDELLAGYRQLIAARAEVSVALVHGSRGDGAVAS